MDYPIGWTGWRDFLEKCAAAAFILLALVFCLLTAPVLAQVPSGYKTRAQINACTLQGCQSQTWFLRNSAWCGKTADGWSPTQGTGRLSVTCRRPL